MMSRPSLLDLLSMVLTCSSVRRLAVKAARRKQAPKETGSKEGGSDIFACGFKVSGLRFRTELKHGRMTYLERRVANKFRATLF